MSLSAAEVWITSQVSECPASRIPALVLDADDRPHVAWFAWQELTGLIPGRSGVYSVRTDDGSWQHEPFSDLDYDPLSVRIYNPAMVMDSRGRLHLAAPEFGASGVRYGVRNEDGWSWSEVAADHDSYPWPSVVMSQGPAGELAIGWHPDNGVAVSFATQDGWNHETLEGDSAPSLAYDAEGRLHAVYGLGDAAGQVYVVRTSEGWSSETVVEGPVGGPSRAIALDADGQPHVVYQTHEGDLGHAWRTSDGWQREQVGLEDNIGDYGIQAAFSDDGMFHLAFEGADRRVYYARRGTDRWSVRQISADRGIPSMAIDSQGRPWFAASQGYRTILYEAVQAERLLVGPRRPIVMDEQHLGREAEGFMPWDQNVAGLAQHPDGRIFAAGAYGYITIHDPATGGQIGRFGSQAPYRSMTFGPEDSLYVTSRGADLAWSIVQFDGQTNETIKSFGNDVLSDNSEIVFSLDGRLLANVPSEDLNREIVVAFDPETGELLGPVMAEPMPSIGGLLIGDDGLLYVGTGKNVERYDPVTGEHLATVVSGDYLDGTIRAMFWENDVLYLGTDQDIAGYNPATGELLHYLSNRGIDAEDALLVVPEPATLSLLTLGGLAILKRRRRLA
ncbi:MAG: WD40 repeat domain-containing protein [Planctomycetota bacterium]